MIARKHLQLAMRIGVVVVVGRKRRNARSSPPRGVPEAYQHVSQSARKKSAHASNKDICVYVERTMG